MAASNNVFSWIISCHIITNYIIVRPKVDQRAGQLRLPHNFVEMKADARSLVRNFFGNKAGGAVKDLNSVCCNNCFENSKLKAYKDIVSTTNLLH